VKSLSLLPGIPLRFVGWPFYSLGIVRAVLTGSDKILGQFTRGAVREPLDVGLS
jgi:hypothetical protein